MEMIPYSGNDSNLEGDFQRLVDLTRARPGNGGWHQGHCPNVAGHSAGDRNPSFAFLFDGRRIATRCFSGCSREAIESALSGVGIRLWAGGSGDGQSLARRTVCVYRHPDDSRPDKEVYRSDYPADAARPDLPCSWKGCGRTDLHKHVWQSPGKQDGYYVHLWAGYEEGDTLVVCEGEKAASSLVGIPGYCPVSWLGGAKAAPKANWEPAQGKPVIIWPDNDNEGLKVAARVRSILRLLNMSVVGNEITVINPVEVEGVKGADAADLATVDERAAWLRSGPIEDGVLPAVGSGGGVAGIRYGELPPTEGDFWVAGDFYAKWDCTYDADCGRMMRRHAGNLLVVTSSRSGVEYSLRHCDGNGMWLASGAPLGRMLIDTAEAWVAEAEGDADDRVESMVKKWQRKQSSQASRDSALRSVGGVTESWRGRGLLPGGLTLADETELDASRVHIGFWNGVVELSVGREPRLLPAVEARGVLVTRQMACNYVPGARDSRLERLMGDWEPENRRFMQQGLGFALLGWPGRRFYFLKGPPRSGKSTLVSAFKAVLGDWRSGGYGLTLDGTALMQDRYASANGHQGGLMGVQDARVGFVSELPDRGQLNAARLRELTGGELMTLREVGLPVQRSARARATLIISVNEPELERLYLENEALLERAAIIHCPAIPEGDLDPSLHRAVQDDMRFREALAAAWVRWANEVVGMDEPPAITESVREEVERRRAESLGELGGWLSSNIVAGSSSDFLVLNDLFQALRRDVPPDSEDDDKWDGKGRRAVLAYARRLLKERGLILPVREQEWRDGVHRQGYRGFRLRVADDAVVEDMPVEDVPAGEPDDYAAFVRTLV